MFFIRHHLADELRAACAKPNERIVDVLHGEHDAQVTESVHWGVAMIRDHGRREESGYLEPAVPVRRTHHGDFNAHVAQSSDPICPVSFNWGAPVELEAELGEEGNGGIDVFHHDADVVHALDRHDVVLAPNVRDDAHRRRRCRSRCWATGGSFALIREFFVEAVRFDFEISAIHVPSYDVRAFELVPHG